jgi:hypothetical protein
MTNFAHLATVAVCHPMRMMPKKVTVTLLPEQCTEDTILAL